MHVVSAHPERHVVVRDCTPLASTDDATGLVDCTKQPAIEAPIVKHTVEALVMAVLPRTPRVNKVGIDPLCPQPCRHPLRNELRAIVTFHIHGRATLGT